MTTQVLNDAQVSQDSRHKILDAAEALFAINGFANTSLRSITSEAKVNLASVNYYFGSKDNLIVEVLSRAIRPLNTQRLELLNAEIKRCHPDGVPLPKILDALLRPCLEMSFDPSREQAMKVLGRSISEEGNFIGKIIEKEWNPLVEQFMKALRQTIPEVSEKDLFWRLQFTVGAMLHSSCHYKNTKHLTQSCCEIDMETTLEGLITYASAGFLAKSSTT